MTRLNSSSKTASSAIYETRFLDRVIFEFKCPGCSFSLRNNMRSDSIATSRLHKFSVRAPTNRDQVLTQAICNHWHWETIQAHNYWKLLTPRDNNRNTNITKVSKLNQTLRCKKDAIRQWNWVNIWGESRFRIHMKLLNGESDKIAVTGVQLMNDCLD